MDLHTPRTGGPLMTVELKNNIIVHWRPHGVPLRFSKMLITDLHYIANDIDEIAGGPHAVVVFTIFAHLVFHPVTFYIHEVAKIRQSVVALLSRAPQTTVVIKSGNTAGVKEVFAGRPEAWQRDAVSHSLSGIHGYTHNPRPRSVSADATGNRYPLHHTEGNVCQMSKALPQWAQHKTQQI
ncbi:NXPE family member 3-like isoform X1 [Onychostoma macrolepis]|uniref:NXPE family member 3-like isoform X1 n=1 Tax=Onychostoma macrolepis TaxID=369639 RepID=UPI00272C4B7A|nr:NXPE family member 3-like isoform X1 [Onychostoma macrolepis]